MKTSVEIRIGNNVRLAWHTVFQCWYMTDDGLAWIALSVRVKSAETAILQALAWYGLPDYR